MSDLESSHNQLPPRKDEAEEPLYSFPSEKRNAIVFTDDDIFLRKIFESDQRKGFELLFKKYYVVLCSHAARFVFEKQKAEDLVADVFLSFWNGNLHENLKGSYRAYLFTAVRNRCLTYLKREIKKQRSDQFNDLQIQTQQPTPDQILQASDLHIRIDKLIKSLPGRQQQVFVMSRLEGKKNLEIAGALQVSLKTVEMHITKTLAAFRKMLGDEW